MREPGDPTRAQSIVQPEQENKKRELSERELFQLVWDSFRFSQGIMELQRSFLQLYHMINPEVSVTLSKDQIDRVAKGIEDGVVKMMTNGAHIYLSDNGSTSSTGGNAWSVDRQTIQVQSRGWVEDTATDLLNAYPFSVREEDVTRTCNEIIDNILYRDTSYVRDVGGRPKRTDRFSSQLISYVLLGEPCKSVEFQSVFDKLAVVMKEKISREPLFREGVKKLHMYWSSHQPPESHQSFAFVEDKFLHRGTITE